MLENRKKAEICKFTHISFTFVFVFFLDSMVQTFHRGLWQFLLQTDKTGQYSAPWSPIQSRPIVNIYSYSEICVAVSPPTQRLIGLNLIETHLDLRFAEALHHQGWVDAEQWGNLDLRPWSLCLSNITSNRFTFNLFVSTWHACVAKWELHKKTSF